MSPKCTRVRPSSLQRRPVDPQPSNVALNVAGTMPLHLMHGSDVVLGFMAEQENSSRGDTARTLVIARLMSLVICAPFFSKSHFVGNLIRASSHAILK
jgi:hypothetical protein